MCSTPSFYQSFRDGTGDCIFSLLEAHLFGDARAHAQHMQQRAYRLLVNGREGELTAMSCRDELVNSLHRLEAYRSPSY